MNLISKISTMWEGLAEPFLIYRGQEFSFKELLSVDPVDLSQVRKGDVVALIGDFDPLSLMSLLRIIDKDAVVFPLTDSNTDRHSSLFETALVDVVIQGDEIRRRPHNDRHELIDRIRAEEHPGLISMSTGTTGPPKAILHDLQRFLQRYETPRPAFRTINFLMLDHIGGLNTLFHTLFNKGTVIAPKARTVKAILDACEESAAEVLPTTPTFLRMLLMSGAVPSKVPSTLRMITYGTERMDQDTLDQLCRLLPEIDFRQTFGISELGVLRVKSKARDSLYMRIGGEGVETRVVDDVLHIRSESCMLGYINAPSPFDAEGWYETKDVVEEDDDGYYKVTGRIGEVINVGGLKFMASEVELVALKFPNVSLVKAFGSNNPVTGEHVEIVVEPLGEGFDTQRFRDFMKSSLPTHMVPKRIVLGTVPVGPRHKKR